MHDLPVSTTERRPETSLTEHSSNSSRIGRAMRAASNTGSQEERNPARQGTTLEPGGQPCKSNWIVASSGAGDGNRTHVRSLGSLQSNSKNAGLAAFLRFSERLNWKIMENGKRPARGDRKLLQSARRPGTLQERISAFPALSNFRVAPHPPAILVRPTANL